MADKIKATILPTGTMHADLTWLLIDPGRMATRSQPQKQKDWVEVPTHVVYIEHPSGTKLIRDSGVPPDWETRWAQSGRGEFFPVDAATEEMWLDSRLKQLNIEPSDVDYLLLPHLHRHPEHRETRDAVAAHEGVFERKPLTYKELVARAATSKDATQAAAEASRERRTAPPTTGSGG